MGKYYIHESNMDRLTKRLTTIQNKCNKYNLSFKFEIVGEEYREVKLEDGTAAVQKYIAVETEGSLRHEDWQFIGVVNHTPHGNVIRQLEIGVEVPEKYRFTKPTCEHCNTSRNRKSTYLIRNTQTGEWKQVGKSCLREFTRGLDAEDVAGYISLFDTLIKGESFDTSSGFKKYYKVSEILSYAFETVKHFGYQPVSDYEPRPTKVRCLEYYAACKGSILCSRPELDSINYQMASVRFDGTSAESSRLAHDAIQWATTQNLNNAYMHNLKVICSSEYCLKTDLGILISLAYTYNRELKRQKELLDKQAKHQKEAGDSDYVGEVGDKIEFNTVSVECIYSGENQFGVSFLYKLIDENSNVFMWSTSTYLEDGANFTIKGRIKNHQEYNGIKQTWITRCRAIKIK